MRVFKRQLAAICSMLFFAEPVMAQSPPEVSQATKDAMLHVLAHEIGHAMLREFDLPIIGPEEDIADDFATIYVHMILPDRAENIISARARQHLLDDDQPEMFSESSQR